MDRKAGAPPPILQRPPGYRDPNAPMYGVSKPQNRKPPPLPSAYNTGRKKRRSCSCCCCCCYLFIFLLILCLLVAAGGAIFYLLYQPKLPIYRLQSIQFPRFNVSAKKDETYLITQTSVRLEAKNPNSKKITFYYGETEVEMNIGEDVDLGSATTPGFTQESEDMRLLKLKTPVKKTLISEGQGTKLVKEFRSESLLVTVEIHTKFGLSVENLKLGKLQLTILCKDVSLKQLNAHADKKCSINLLKWNFITSLNYSCWFNAQH